MLPASNRGAGQSLCFPDVCLTPAPPAPPIPVPYPNIGMNAQAQGFSPNVKICQMNALNLGSKISMTSGDEAGAAHPSIKGAGGYSMGNPVVTINKLPAITLTSLANGNNMNAPVGAVLVPSAVTVVFCDRAASERVSERVDEEDGAGAGAGEGAGAGLSASAALWLGEAARVGDDCVRAREVGGVAVVTLTRLAPGAHATFRAALRRLGGLGRLARGLVLDLRGLAGGDLDVAVECAGALLPRGAPIARRLDPDGDESTLLASQGGLYAGPLAVLVDQGTASAAEVLAGALAYHDRATLVGERTFGKWTAQAIVGRTSGPRPAIAYETIAWIQLPNGRSGSLEPHVEVEPRRALEVALAELAGAPRRRELGPDRWAP